MKRCCAPRYVFDLLGRKWVYKILRHLHTPRSFSELQELLPGITNHVLSEELKTLVSEDILFHEKSSYALTEDGKRLLVAAEPLFRWGESRGMSICPSGQDCSKCVRHCDC